MYPFVTGATYNGLGKTVENLFHYKAMSKQSVRDVTSLYKGDVYKHTIYPSLNLKTGSTNLYPTSYETEIKFHCGTNNIAPEFTLCTLRCFY